MVLAYPTPSNSRPPRHTGRARSAALLAFAALAVNSVAWAQSEPTQRAVDETPPSAPLACTIQPIIAPPPANAQASLTADKASLDEDGVARASGAVRLEKGDQALEAPELIYNRDTSQATVNDGLQYYRPGINLSADSAKVNINDETGTFNGAKFSLSEQHGRGSANKVQSFGDGTYELSTADYSTCPGPKKAWRLSAKTIELDQNKGRGEAYNAVLKIFELPVFYTPYINFPIDDKRHTGFLLPKIGVSGSSGFELATPYYINIAPNLDATLTPRVLSKRGVQLGGQARYLTAHSTGGVTGEYLPSDQDFGADRDLISLNHIGRLGRHFGLRVNYTRVSDDQYFEDLGSNLSSTSKSQLEQAAEFSFAATGVRFSVLTQNYQTLDNDQNQTFLRAPYQQLPRAHLSLLSPTAPWHAGLDADFANFNRDDSVSGLRYDVRPRVGLGVDKESWYARSEASYRYTRYDLHDTAAGAERQPERQIPSVSAETGLRLERSLSNGWLQTLEPRVFYLYNGFDNQDSLPVFDTGVPDLRFERLFADNRFVGTDRIGDANQVTLGLTSRFIDAQDGRTVVKLDLGRIYGFETLDVHLPTQSPIGFGKRNSDIVGNAEYAPLPYLHSALTLQYDPGSDRFNRGSVRAGYRDKAGRRLDVGYRYYRNFRPLNAATNSTSPSRFETLEQTDVLVQYPLTQSLKVIGRWNYSLKKSQSVETLGGLEYRPSCCWAIRGAWRRFVHDDRGQYDTAVLLQIELTGLGRFGDDIDRVLERDTVPANSGFNSFLYP